MTPQIAYLKLKYRLNKLDSQDYDNISLLNAVEAINKAAIDWVRRQVHGSNASREGDEETRMRIDDLQFLLKPKTLSGINKKIFFESDKFPTDYLWYKRILPEFSRGECKSKIFKSVLAEEANVPDLLEDDNNAPSFDFEQCFHTLVGNKIRVYTNGEFFVNKIDLVYYRNPIKMDIAGYEHEDGTPSTNVDLEFKDDIAEIIINEAASIIAGDIESANQLQINATKVDKQD